MLSESDDGTGLPVFPADMETLLTADVLPDLVVVDAWIDTVPGGLGVKDTQNARRAVAPWKAYAAATNAAVLLVTHTNRGEHTNLRNTYGLSVALRQVARNALYAAEDPDTRALLVGPDKSNLGMKAPAERFERTSVQRFDATPHNDGTVPRLDHLGTDGRTINAAVAEQSATGHRPGTSDIDAWLRTTLAEGSMAQEELADLAIENRYSPGQLRRAKERLGTQTVKIGKQWYVSMKMDG